MKRIKFCAIVAVAFMMVTCNKDNNNDSGPKEMTLILEGYEVLINMVGSGVMTIDWGDGSEIETHTLSAFGGKYGYTYSEISTYTITVTGENITHISCSKYNESHIKSLDVHKNTALISLGCSGNELTSLDISKNTMMRELYCSNNSLTDLDVSKNIALTKLYCSDNQLTSLDLKRNTALTELYCENNQLTSLNLSRNTALTILYCAHNGLTALDVSKNAALIYLYCVNNQLTSLDLKSNIALKELYCVNNQLTSLNLSSNIALLHVMCGLNNLTTSALNALFETLSPNNQGGKIDIRGNPGADDCNRNIATDKGWAVL